MAASLLAFAVLIALMATARSVHELVLGRLLTGLGASGVVPLALVLVARLYPHEQRGRPLGWIFDAMAGGMAVGSTVGAVLEPCVGWRALSVSVGIAGALMLVVLLPHRKLGANAQQVAGGSLGALLRGCRELFGHGARTAHLRLRQLHLPFRRVHLAGPVPGTQLWP